MFFNKKNNPIISSIPGQKGIELISYYKEFKWYYPNCELNTKKWFIENAKPDWIYIDAGANIGIYTILFSILSPSGFVYAFEPTKTATFLKENCKHNKVSNVEIIHKALGKTSETKKEKIFRIWGNEPENLIYEFITIDDFVEINNISKINAIKIDVDSFDFEVLQGAVQTLKNLNPWVICELNHALSKRNQSNSEAFLWLQNQGYKTAFVIDHENFVMKKNFVFDGKAFSLIYP
jgi:FkbM family methyltransferase